jgi:hypothetical protein
MNLGSIVHIQHYFARTGLLDGKGGQLHTGKVKIKPPRNSGSELSVLEASDLLLHPRDSSYSSMQSSPEIMTHGSEVHLDGVLVEGNEEAIFDDYDDPTMLPPTVSTYSYREKPVPPPPALNELRHELKQSLSEAKKVLKDAQNEKQKEVEQQAQAQVQARAREQEQAKAQGHELDRRRVDDESVDDLGPLSPISGPGWYQLQGMHIIDILTLAIRASKMYSTAHDQPARLSAIKPEKEIREDMLAVLDVLKRIASRNFAGGIKTDERELMEQWVSSMEELIRKEEELERAEAEKHRGSVWIDGDWTGQEMEREYLFLASFDTNDPPLSSWKSATDVDDLPTPFLKELQDGLRLVKLHNEMVKRSKRPFGQISVFHTDTAKPYRCAENLRYWIKAAELRWEVHLKVDVMGVVGGTSLDAWKGFEQAVLKWSQTVREEITQELKTGQKQ